MAGKRSRDDTRRSSTKRWIFGVLGVVVIVLGVVGFYAYSQLTSAREDLDLASAQATTLQDALTAGDVSAATAALASLQAHVDSADSTLGNPVFSIGEKMPFAGKNISAVRTVTSAVKSIADDGLPPLVEVADQFNAKTFNPEGGAIDVDAIEKIAPNVRASAKVIGAAAREISSVDASSLLGAVQGPVLDVQDKIGDAASIASRASTASAVAPEMLQGTHRYLLLFQNNAEIRATGGLPGAWAVLEVEDGKISLGEQGSGASMGDLPKEVTAITPEERDLFDVGLVRDFRNINFTPDFPRAAFIGAKILQLERNIDVDGVVSLDPVTLSYLLKGTGPITLADGTTLTETNAVEVLLNGVYVNYPDPDTQDVFFAAATDKIFDNLLNGAANPTEVLSALTRATNERRVAVWSDDKGIQSELAGTAVAGELPVGGAADSALGIYLNDATGAKMQYYLDYDITAESVRCSAAGVQTYETTTTLRSKAPADAADLPASIKGPGYGALPGTMLLNTYVYAPDGGKVTQLTIDGKETTSFPGTHHGRGVTQVTVEVGPGQTTTVEATVVSGKNQRASAQVLSTPSVTPGTKASTITSSC